MNARYMQIGSWNIEHLSKVDPDDPADRKENEYALSEHIQMAGVDVLALQEIYVTDTDTWTNRHLDAAFELIHEHTGATWEYELFRKRRRDNTEQLCGIAWNTDAVKKVGETRRIDVTTKVERDGKTLHLWDRIPHAVKFSAGEGKLDLVVIPLHMKSNFGGSRKAMKVRHEEAKTLMKKLPAVLREMREEDVVLIGDTNIKGSYEKAIEVFADYGFEDLNADDIPTFVNSQKAPFDRIFVPKRAEDGEGEPAREFRFSRQYILRSADPDAHDRYLSDHYIIKTTVKILRDDD